MQDPTPSSPTRRSFVSTTGAATVAAVAASMHDRFALAEEAAAKAGVAGTLARELGSRNVTVNCVAPGFIATDMTAGLPDAQQQALLAQIPLGRLGTVEEVAHAVCFLASPLAGYVTGTELHVNGGMYMA